MVKVSDYIAAFLHAQGVEQVFELTGGMITHLLDSLHLQGKVKIVSIHHEQTAAFAADAVGRLTGVPGVAFATSGPGATNLVTGIGSCYFDSSPAVFITGQVNRHEMKGDRPVRQLGFQETDVVSIVQPITKAAWQVREPEDIPEALARAFTIALEGRPGPVLIDIPMDVQYAQIDVSPDEIPVVTQRQRIETEPLDLGPLFEALAQAERPLILAGGGVRAANAIPTLRTLAQKLGVPVVKSLLAVDVMPYDDPLNVGMIGTYGNRWANMAISRSDLMLVVGSRLDIRQTGAQTAAFKGDREIFHVDVETGEINNRVTGVHPIVADLRDFLAQAIPAAEGHTRRYDTWVAEIDALRTEWPDTQELENVEGINPNALMHSLSQMSREAGVFVADVGQHQMWAGQSLEIGADQRWVTSGGMGSMGFALPAAIGAAFAVAPRPVVLVAGDGGFQCNIQELQTVVRNRLPIKMVVLDNGAHGMLRQFQQTYFDGRYQSSIWGYSTPDFAKVAEAYGIPGHTIAEVDALPKALEWLWSDPTQPALLRVMIDTFANAYPKIAFGRPIGEMEPLATPIGMEGT
jgi:acetolactate synthase-1/2/3 large subunit